MRWVPLTLLAGLLATFAVASHRTEARTEEPRPAEAAPAAPDYNTDIRPLLKAYCFECHSATKRKAGLDLEKFDTAAAALEQAEVWDQVGERIRAEEMPPAKSKQPTADEREKLLS